MNLAKFVVVGTLLSFKWKNVIISVRHNFDISYTWSQNYTSRTSSYFSQSTSRRVIFIVMFMFIIIYFIVKASTNGGNN